MTLHANDEAPVRRNLSDAACPREMIERFMTLRSEGRLHEQLALLGRHRKMLLGEVHAGAAGAGVPGLSALYGQKGELAVIGSQGLKRPARPGRLAGTLFVF